MLPFLLALVLSSTVTAAEKFHPLAGVEPPAGRYLVTLGNLALADDAAALATRLAAQYGGRLEPFAQDGLRGFMIVMTPARARLLSDDPRIASVDEVGETAASAVTAVPLDTTGGPAPPASASRAVPNAGSGSYSIGTYSYDGVANIRAINGTAGQETFVYDPFNRIVSGTYGAQSQAYAYDRYGNVTTITTAGEPPRRLAVNPANNRVDLPAGTQYNVTGSYDGSGNQQQMLWTDGGVTASHTYDALSVETASVISATRRLYLYTATDERLATFDLSSGTQSWTIRSAGNQLLRRFTRQGSGGALQWEEDYVYGGTQMLGAYTAGAERVLHFFPDHLGTPRLITGAGGAKVSEHRYYAFGEEFFGRGADGERKKFTGHERDSIPGLPAAADVDYMHARYYTGLQGRFFVADPSMDFRSTLHNPQRWNRYAYVSNNPMTSVDPDGREEYFMTEQWFREQQMVGDGKMTEEQYWERRMAESKGMLVGAGIVAAAYAGPVAWRYAAQFVTRHLAVSGPGSVMLGETMRRVQAVADKMKSETFKTAEQGFEKLMAANMRWLQQQIAAGKTIYDIGRNPFRTDGGSPFYRAEVATLRAAGYVQQYLRDVKINGRVYELYQWVRPAGACISGQPACR
jgi:RHS repeat-associated protein